MEFSYPLLKVFEMFFSCFDDHKDLAFVLYLSLPAMDRADIPDNVDAGCTEFIQYLLLLLTSASLIPRIYRLKILASIVNSWELPLSLHVFSVTCIMSQRSFFFTPFGNIYYVTQFA